MPAAPKVTLTAAALADLDRVDLFLRTLNPAAADRLQDRLADLFDLIAAAPRIGRPWTAAPPDTEWRKRVLRFGRSRYIIRYAIEPDAVIILRIHHAKEDR